MHKVDIIDITEDTAKTTPKYIEVIDLTDDNVTATVRPERLADFRRRIHSIFRKDKKQSMSLLRLARRVNLGHAKRFSKMEMDSAMLQMADANELSVANGMVYLI